MKRQMFQENCRNAKVQKILKERGSQTLEEMKRILYNETHQVAPDSDQQLHAWLKSIDGIDSRIVNKVRIYDYVDSDIFDAGSKETVVFPESKKRRNFSPPDPPIMQTPKRQYRGKPSVIEKPVPANFQQMINALEGATSATVKPKTRTRPTKSLREGPPQIYDYYLVGDDNFLNIALFDLNFRQNPHERRRQSGYCMSGLRINEATEMILEMDEDIGDVIINVGSVDIAEGRQLIEIIMDYSKLIDACNQRLIQPVLTTLAPLPNLFHTDKKHVHKAFNEFILHRLSRYKRVIDLHKCLVHHDGRTDYSMFQPEPRYISGSKKSFVLWNKLGRIRVKNLLVNDIGYACLYSDFLHHL